MSEVVVAVVRVGVGVLIRDPLHPGKIFAGLRRNSHGAGTLALPGGHLEMFESWEECAKRETKEETGLTIGKVRFGYVTNDVMQDVGKHYVTIFMMGDVITMEEKEEGGEYDNEYDGTNVNARNDVPLPRPKNLEPHKCDGWDSYSWEELRQFASFSRNNCSGAAGITTNGNDMESTNENDDHKERRNIVLFGPLLKLVEEAPSNVVDFINNKAT